MSEVTFEPFQKVLVRDFDHNEWKINFFERKCGDYFLCFSGNWKQCIPYNDETAHLLGTTDSPTPPEPEFKWGDHVEVSNDRITWRRAIYYRLVADSQYLHSALKKDGLFSFQYCRHADW